MRWPTRFNLAERRVEAVLAWDSLKNLLRWRLVVGDGALVLVADAGGRNANGGHGHARHQCGGINWLHCSSGGRMYSFFGYL